MGPVLSSLAALVSGLVFGLGLIVSGMTNPLKVQNFLDPLGTFDPSLAFVMGGAIAVALPGFWLVRKRGRPLFAERLRLPAKRDVDTPLVGGAVLFGVGWGLAGYCPGPALTAVPFANTGTLVFVAAMIAGFYLARLLRPGAADGAAVPDSFTTPAKETHR
ncbi:MAG: DUF6691 family protein [Devosia sp.]